MEILIELRTEYLFTLLIYIIKVSRNIGIEDRNNIILPFSPKRFCQQVCLKSLYIYVNHSNIILSFNRKNILYLNKFSTTLKNYQTSK